MRWGSSDLTALPEPAVAPAFLCQSLEPRQPGEAGSQRVGLPVPHVRLRAQVHRG